MNILKKLYTRQNMVLAFLVYIFIVFLTVEIKLYGLQTLIPSGAYILTELIIIYFISNLLLSAQAKIYTFLFFIFFTLCLLILNIQLMILEKTAEFLSVLILENMFSFNEILSYTMVNFLCKNAIIFACFIIAVLYAPTTRTTKHLFFLLIVSALFLLQNITEIKYYFPYNQTPITSFFHTIYLLTHPKHYNNPEENIEIFSENPYFNYNPKSPNPFQKDYVYTENNVFEMDNSRPLNVITIFMEGSSSRMFNCYGGKYKGLTPNIDDFAQESMRIDNYYNHTAATYRGIPGQLTSTYPLFDWKAHNKLRESFFKNEYTSLPKILNSAGYETIFFLPHEKDVLKEILPRLKFNKIFTASDIAKKFLQREIEIKQDSIKDEHLFEGLIEYLKTYSSSKPFYLGIYNVETHAFVDTATNGVKYGNGKNNVLNNIHNFDKQFGKLWRYLKKNNFLDNTIIILTADHAHFYEPSYVELQNKDYQPVFTDAIPLIIKAPFKKFPSVYDAQFRTSVDYAPTVLNLLGINNVRNNFMGHSIFSKEHLGIGICSFGINKYIIHEGKIKKYHNLCAQDKIKAKQMEAYINFFYHCEQHNKLNTFPNL